MLRLITVLLVITTFFSRGYAQERNKPNIVYILADDMGIGDVSSLNPDSKIETPNIDKLVNQGMNFTDAHTASSVCTPTRYGIITGRYPWRTKLKKGVVDGYSKTIIADGIDTTPALLKRNGYQTAMVGKWHLGWNWVINDVENIKMDEKIPDYKYAEGVEDKVDFTKPFTEGPTDKGFDYFFGVNASLDFPPYTFMINNRVSAMPTEMQASRGPDKTDPNWKKHLDAKQKMQRKGLAAPNFDSGETLLKLTQNSVKYIEDVSKEKPFFLYVALTAPHTPVLPRKDFVGTSKAGSYGDFTQELDWSVGEIVKALKEKGVVDNTIIIFTTDNGASRISFPPQFEGKYGHKPSRELRGRKGSLYEGGHRVPFIVQWNNIVKPNSTNNTTISLNDLYSTCASIVGEKVKDQGVDSYSILSELKGETGKYGRTVSVYSDFGGRYAVRKGSYKMILSPKKKKRSLYNLNDDISEKNNLYGKPGYENIQKDLMTEITKIISNGRSTEGKVLKNEGPKVWDALYWMK